MSQSPSQFDVSSVNGTQQVVSFVHILLISKTLDSTNLMCAHNEKLRQGNWPQKPGFHVLHVVRYPPSRCGSYHNTAISCLGPFIIQHFWNLSLFENSPDFFPLNHSLKGSLAHTQNITFHFCAIRRFKMCLTVGQCSKYFKLWREQNFFAHRYHFVFLI